jgi:peroxiredoxin
MIEIMKMKLVAVFCFLFCSGGHSQTINLSAILKAVQKAQNNLKTADYLVERVDTLLTGDIRTMAGKVLIERDNSDTLLGFRFWARRDIDQSERVYDGHIGYEINLNSKTYQLLNTPVSLHSLLLGSGGYIVISDLVRIDTSQAKEIEISHDDKKYYLTILYPDLTKYDVVNRRKIITIDKSTMLPIAVRSHQENYGKVQDLYYKITKIQVNQSINYNFSSPPFLKEYALFIPPSTRNPWQALLNKPAPVFNLTSFDGKIVSSTDLKGKAVLLDFWEVWCGPCIESMPKIKELYNKYKEKGLEAYGITNDLKQISSAKAFAKKRELNFPVLIGNEKLRQEYNPDGAVPLYVLIDKTGKISFISPGYSSSIEEIIVDVLNK